MGGHSGLFSIQRQCNIAGKLLGLGEDGCYMKYHTQPHGAGLCRILSSERAALQAAGGEDVVLLNRGTLQIKEGSKAGGSRKAAIPRLIPWRRISAHVAEDAIE